MLTYCWSWEFWFWDIFTPTWSCYMRLKSWFKISNCYLRLSEIAYILLILFIWTWCQEVHQFYSHSHTSCHLSQATTSNITSLLIISHVNLIQFTSPLFLRIGIWLHILPNKLLFLKNMKMLSTTSNSYLLIYSSFSSSVIEESICFLVKTNL